MNPEKTNIVLIGMPGSGKSTVGIILAKLLKMHFLDSDILIQSFTNRTLQEIVNFDGHMALRAIEEKVLLGIDCQNHIIATGGSAAYSALAMSHLKSEGIVIFLHTDLSALQARIQNYETRGLAKRPEQTLSDLFEERKILYEKFADITVESTGHTQDQVCYAIKQQLQESPYSTFANKHE